MAMRPLPEPEPPTSHPACENPGPRSQSQVPAPHPSWEAAVAWESALMGSKPRTPSLRQSSGEGLQSATGGGKRQSEAAEDTWSQEGLVPSRQHREDAGCRVLRGRTRAGPTPRSPARGTWPSCRRLSRERQWLQGRGAVRLSARVLLSGGFQGFVTGTAGP